MRFLSLLLILATTVSSISAGCNNNPPDNKYSCEQQKTWGKCNESFMKGFCELTCNTCVEVQQQCNESPPPPGMYSCAQQKVWGKCSEPWMMGYCQMTCGTCKMGENPPPVMNTPTCTDIAPDTGISFSCQQQRDYGKCNESWMKGYCQITCPDAQKGPCQCNDSPPPAGSDGVQYSCDQQRMWGKCGEPWMKGYCENACKTCTCNDLPPPQQLYTCQQQKDFSQCDAPWMAGRCLRTCGKCMNTPPVPVVTQAPAQPTKPTPTTTCSDNPPGGGYTCEQQKTWGKCGETWMNGYCQVTCGKCTPPNYTPPTVNNPPPNTPPIKASSRLAVQDRNLVLNGRRMFLSGANMAWQNYGSDFGAGSPGSKSYPSQIKDAMVAIRQAGGNSLRMWLHCGGEVSPTWGSDGKVTGIPGDLIPSLRSFLQTAREQNILVVLVLWNFMITKKHANFYYDDTIVQSYIDNALIPMVQALKDEPALATWEISNEPEGAAQEYGWEDIKVPIARIQRAVNWQSDAIHKLDINQLVTVGSWAADASTDINGYTNRYRNDRLFAEGGRSLGYVDYYQVHYYGWMGRNNPRSFVDNPREYYKLDKPLILGEFSQAGTPGMSIEQIYAHAYDAGYDGAWAWQINGGGQDADSFATILRGISALSARRPQGLSVDLNGQIPASFFTSSGAINIIAEVPELAPATGPDMNKFDGPVNNGASTPTNNDPMMTTTGSKPNVAVIAGVAAGVAVLVLVIVAAIVIHRRKQRTRVESTSQRMTV